MPGDFDPEHDVSRFRPRQTRTGAGRQHEEAQEARNEPQDQDDALNKLDTGIKERDDKLRELDTGLKKQDDELRELDTGLTDQGQELVEFEASLKDHDITLKEFNARLAELDRSREELFEDMRRNIRGMTD